MYSWSPGGGRAGEAFYFIRRIPSDPQNRDNNRAFGLQTSCLADVPTYHKRVKKATFLANLVHPSFIQSNATTCAIYIYLTGDHLPREICKGKDSALIMAEVALSTQDFNGIHDLRELNGRPKNTPYEVEIGCEIKSMLESHARVDDRCHGKANQFVCGAFIFQIKHVLTK
jgi:hypothetical protein